MECRVATTFDWEWGPSTLQFVMVDSWILLGAHRNFDWGSVSSTATSQELCKIPTNLQRKNSRLKIPICQACNGLFGPVFANPHVSLESPRGSLGPLGSHLASSHADFAASWKEEQSRQLPARASCGLEEHKGKEWVWKWGYQQIHWFTTISPSNLVFGMKMRWTNWVLVLGASSVISLDPKIETPVFLKMQNEFDSSDLMLFQLRHRYCTCQSCLSNGCPLFLPSPCRCVFFGVHLQVASSAIPSRRLRRRWLRSMVGWWWVSGSYDII